MAIRKILQAAVAGGSAWEDTFLHKEAIQVKGIDENVLSTIEDLHDTLWAYPFCTGLSAPQIGIEYAISVVNLKEDEEKEDLILINPIILSVSGKKDKKHESCMSVWGETGDVERRDKIILEYRDVNFTKKQLECKGRLSRTIQHEVDHLHGILYPEKIIRGSALRHADFFDSYNVLGEFISGGDVKMG